VVQVVLVAAAAAAATAAVVLVVLVQLSSDQIADQLRSAQTQLRPTQKRSDQLRRFLRNSAQIRYQISSDQLRLNSDQLRNVQISSEDSEA